MSNQLITVSEAAEQLGTTSELPANKALTKSEFDALLPVGTILYSPDGSGFGENWKLCDGSTVLKSEYPDLNLEGKIVGNIEQYVPFKGTSLKTSGEMIAGMMKGDKLVVLEGDNIKLYNKSISLTGEVRKEGEIHNYRSLRDLFFYDDGAPGIKYFKEPSDVKIIPDGASVSYPDTCRGIVDSSPSPSGIVCALVEEGYLKLYKINDNLEFSFVKNYELNDSAKIIYGPLGAIWLINDRGMRRSISIQKLDSELNEVDSAKNFGENSKHSFIPKYGVAFMVTNDSYESNQEIFTMDYTGRII